MRSTASRSYFCWVRHTFPTRIRVPIVLLAVLALTASACSSSASGSSPVTNTSPGSATSTATTLADPAIPVSSPAGVSTLASVGIGVYADAGQTVPIDAVSASSTPNPIRLLDTQAQAMLLEAADGQGLLGATVDSIVGTDPGMPPPSFLVAGWVTGSTSPRAMYAHTLMGEQPWKNAPAIVFPNLVLALYASDTAEFASLLSGTSDATAVPTGSSPASAPNGQSGFRSLAGGQLTLSRSLVVGLCSKVQGFINGTVSALFDAIGHLAKPTPPADTSGFFGTFVAGVTAGYGLAVGAVNGLIDVAHFLVQKLIGLVTQPVLGYIARIAGVLGTVSLVVSFLRPWTIRMDAAPPSTRKAIGDEPGIAGAVTATVDLGGYDEWPTDIADCALNAGVTLPPLKPVGAPIVWTLTQPDALAVATANVPTVLDANASAVYGYATTQESLETSKGDPASGVMTIHASIRRPAVADAQQTITNLVFDQIPDLIRPILQPLLAPAIKTVLDKIASVLDSTADAQVTVDFHTPPATTTTSTPPTTAAPPGTTVIEPCSLLSEQDAAAAMGTDLGAGFSTPEPWGGQCNIGDGTILLNVITGPTYGGGAAGYGQYLAAAQQGKANDTTGQSVFEVLTGIGDGAFVNGGGPIAGCAFYIGNTTVALTVATDNAKGPPPIAEITAIAKTAAAHLGG
jgi:hypothetical protein